jgi:dihydroxyacetone kinase-like protein
MLTVSLAKQWLFSCAELIKKNKDYLTALDAAIGDADHGLNMDRGFTKSIEVLNQKEPKTLEELFNIVGMTLLSTVGGVSGPLYGTLFIQFSKASKDKEIIQNEELYDFILQGIEGVTQRGKALLEDKTMLDVLIPVADGIKSGINSTIPFDTFCNKIESIAEEAARHTKNLVARKGRASYLGERSLGHQDPGATSSFYLIKTLMETLRKND